MSAIYTGDIAGVVDTTNPVNAIVLPIFVVISTMTTYLPFRSFWQNRIFPAANLVLILVFLNINWFAGALIWPNGDFTSWWNGAGYCDFLVYVRVPITTAIATSLFALMRTLVNALDVDRHNFFDTPAMRRRVLIIDVLICWTIPVIQIALFYLVQKNRYAIVPIYGCVGVYDQSWLDVLIFYPWVLMCTVACAYQAILVMYRLRQLNTDLSRYLSSNNSGYTARRYLKLFIIAVFVLVVFLPTEGYTFYVNIPRKIQPYSFAKTHDPRTWNMVIYLPASYVPVAQYYGWFTIAVCFEVFAFFGFSDESIDVYRKGLVMLGFGLIWPTLKGSRESRRLRRRAGETRSSNLSSRFDLVGLAIKYVDSSLSRKNSKVTNMPESEFGKSRKASHATCNNIPLATVTSNGSSANPSFFDTDIITPAPATSEVAITLPPIQEPEPTASPPRNRGILSTWRTHIHLQFPFFSNTSATEQVQSANDDVENIAGRKGSLSNISNPQTSLSNVIWSETFPATQSSTTTTPPKHATHPSNSTLPSIDESLDPLSPKLGSRAYRERERREMERDRKEAREAVLAKKNARNAEAGEVVQDTSMDANEEGPDGAVK